MLGQTVDIVQKREILFNLCGDDLEPGQESIEEINGEYLSSEFSINQYSGRFELKLDMTAPGWDYFDLKAHDYCPDSLCGLTVNRNCKSRHGEVISYEVVEVDSDGSEYLSSLASITRTTTITPYQSWTMDASPYKDYDSDGAIAMRVYLNNPFRTSSPLLNVLDFDLYLCSGTRWFPNTSKSATYSSKIEFQVGEPLVEVLQFSQLPISDLQASHTEFYFLPS